MEGPKGMTIRTNGFVLLAFVAVAACCNYSICRAANTGSLSPIPSSGTYDVESVIAEQNGQCQECMEPAGGCCNILTDNVLTRAIYCFSRDFKRNNCWPRPFVWNDREATRASFVVMTNKGWQRENTLGEYHFDHRTHQLNEPGRRRVYWIINQEIPGRRAIFVCKAMRHDVTEARVDSVQQWVAQIVPQGDMPPVLETNLAAPGRPAEEVDHIRQEYLKSMPAPRLPENTSMDFGSTDQ